MKTITRRKFMAQAALSAAGGLHLSKARAAEPARIRIGSCTISLPQAKEAGLAGLSRLDGCFEAMGATCVSTARCFPPPICRR